jgi:type IV secretory pathway VirB9-like protein
VGDKDYWIVNGVHNLCYLHPAQAGIRTNMNLVTASGHIYSFLLTEISKYPNETPDLKVFVVPKDEPRLAHAGSGDAYVRASVANAYKQEAADARIRAAQEVREVREQTQAKMTAYREEYPAKLKFDYRYKPSARRPPFSVTAIYHDDKFTYIKSNAQEKPTIYEVKDGKPDLVNFQFQNGVYIIPEIVGKGYLAVGKKKLSFERRTQG